MHSLFAPIYSIFILLIALFSFHGYGQIFTNLLTPKFSKNSGLCTIFGVAFFLNLSGFIELFQIGSPGLMSGFIFFGVLIQIATGGISRVIYCSRNVMLALKSLSKIKLFSIFIVGILFLITFIDLVNIPFNFHDDYEGYFVFAMRVLQEGYQGGDPFNVRGIEQGFGAGNYLNALFLNLIPLGNIRFAEAGSGFVLLVILAIGHLKTYSNNFWGSLIVVTSVCIVSIYAPVLNISPIFMGCALIYATLFFCTYPSCKFEVIYSLLFGFLISGLILLKGNFVLSGGVILGAFYLTRLFLVRERWVVLEFVITICAIVLCIAPWLMSNVHFSNTAFYPILGVGIVDSGSLGLVSKNVFLDVIENSFAPFYALLFLAWGFSLYFSGNRYVHIFSFCLIVLTMLATGLLALTPAGGLRYVYATLTMPLIYLIVLLVGVRFKAVTSSLLRSSSRYFYIFLMALGLLLSIPLIRQAYNQVRAIGSGYSGLIKLKNISNISEIDVSSPQFFMQQKRVQDLQLFIPENTQILVRLDLPFLFDFSRNRIYVMDWPGSSGPLPGVPYLGTSEDLAHYLRSNRIRYVVFSYRNEALYSRRDYMERLKHPSTWIRNISSRTFAVQQRLIELGNDYKVVHDNGSDFILDLCVRQEIEKQELCSDF